MDENTGICDDCGVDEGPTSPLRAVPRRIVVGGAKRTVRAWLCEACRACNHDWQRDTEEVDRCVICGDMRDTLAARISP